MRLKNLAVSPQFCFHAIWPDEPFLRSCRNLFGLRGFPNLVGNGCYDTKARNTFWSAQSHGRGRTGSLAEKTVIANAWVRWRRSTVSKHVRSAESIMKVEEPFVMLVEQRWSHGNHERSCGVAYVRQVNASEFPPLPTARASGTGHGGDGRSSMPCRPIRY